MEKLSTLCYIERDGQYLMLHRTVKENDVNRDKWIGVGGHFEHGESPEECLLREVREETGYTLTSWKYRGIVTFVYGEDVVEYMSLYTADGFTGNPIACDEGELEWVDKDRIFSLELWEGDKIFFLLSDNGKGMAVTQLKEGFGLRGMSARAEALGGSVRFETEEDEGFEIHITLPADSVKNDKKG